MVDSTPVPMVGELMMVNILQKSSVMDTRQDTLKHSPWFQQRVQFIPSPFRILTKHTALIDKSRLGQKLNFVVYEVLKLETILILISSESFLFIVVV